MARIIKVSVKGPVSLGKKHRLEITYEAPSQGTAWLTVEPSSFEIVEATKNSSEVTLKPSGVETMQPIDIVIRAKKPAEVSAEAPPKEASAEAPPKVGTLREVRIIATGKLGGSDGDFAKLTPD